MPVDLIDPKSKLMKVYYTQDEVRALVVEIVEEAENWCGEDLQVVSNRVLFDHGFLLKE